MTYLYHDASNNRLVKRDVILLVINIKPKLTLYIIIINVLSLDQ